MTRDDAIGLGAEGCGASSRFSDSWNPLFSIPTAFSIVTALSCKRYIHRHQSNDYNLTEYNSLLVLMITLTYFKDGHT